MNASTYAAARTTASQAPAAPASTKVTVLLKSIVDYAAAANAQCTAAVHALPGDDEKAHHQLVSACVLMSNVALLAEFALYEMGVPAYSDEPRVRAWLLPPFFYGEGEQK